MQNTTAIGPIARTPNPVKSQIIPRHPDVGMDMPNGLSKASRMIGNGRHSPSFFAPCFSMRLLNNPMQNWISRRGLAQTTLGKTMKINHPLGPAMFIIGKTIAGIIGVYLIGVFFVYVLWGDEGAAFSLFTIGFMLLAPIALIRAAILAARRFALDRARIRNEKSA